MRKTSHEGSILRKEKENEQKRHEKDRMRQKRHRKPEDKTRDDRDLRWMSVGWGETEGDRKEEECIPEEYVYLPIEKSHIHKGIHEGEDPREGAGDASVRATDEPPRPRHDRESEHIEESLRRHRTHDCPPSMHRERADPVRPLPRTHDVHVRRRCIVEQKHIPPRERHDDEDEAHEEKEGGETGEHNRENKEGLFPLWRAKRFYFLIPLNIVYLTNILLYVKLKISVLTFSLRWQILLSHL